MKETDNQAEGCSRHVAVNRKTKEIELLMSRQREATERCGIHEGKELEDDRTKIVEKKAKDILQKSIPLIPSISSFGTSNYKLFESDISDKSSNDDSLVFEFETNFLCILTCSEIIESVSFT